MSAFLVMGCASLLVVFKTGVLGREHRGKPGVVLEVASPQPAGLLEEPVGPLEARGLHPARGLARAAGEEVEGRPDPDHDGRNAPYVLCHPDLLLRASEPDQQDADAGGADLAHVSVIFFCGQLSERRGDAAGHAEARVALLQRPNQAVEALLRAAVEPHRDALADGALDYVREEVRAPYLGRPVDAQPAERPHKRS